eukprot:398334-Pleurochrysis_carterae.AAC.1
MAVLGGHSFGAAPTHPTGIIRTVTPAFFGLRFFPLFPFRVSAKFPGRKQSARAARAARVQRARPATRIHYLRSPLA